MMLLAEPDITVTNIWHLAAALTRLKILVVEVAVVIN